MTLFLKLDSIVKQTIRCSFIFSLTAFSLIACSQVQPPKALLVKPSKSNKATLVSTQRNYLTLKNLQKAYNFESNSNVMYLSFALKAHEEGYKDVATLFKALARAEEIHRDNYARLIQAMGAIPNNTMIIPQVNSTVDKPVGSTVNNLAQLISGNLGNSVNRETDERKMYDKFIKQAKLENNSAALKTFNNAITAENQHSQLFAQAYNNLDDWNQATRSFYVCTTSGEIFERHPKPKVCSQNYNENNIEQITW